jgi:hydroxycarboxylate dehydrogenase B
MARRVFLAAGTPRHIADVVAEILVNADLTGYDSHGVMRIPEYVRAIEHGTLDPAAEPAVLRETAQIALLDGRQGFGHYAARAAMQAAVAKAQKGGLGGVSLVRAGHLGRLGEYAEQAARAGCIGLIAAGHGAPGQESTVPYGGLRGALGTNPMAAGVPAGAGPPFVLDYATSVMAGGKIVLAGNEGTDLPEAGILDRHGHPSARPADLFDGGFLLPFGRHKGYALSLLVCLLGGLSGAFDPARGTMGGTFVLAIDVDAFTPVGDYRRAVRALLDGVKATPTAPGFHEILTPGDRAQRSRADRLAHGIDLPDRTHRELRACAERLGVAWTEDSDRDDDVDPAGR